MVRGGTAALRAIWVPRQAVILPQRQTELAANQAAEVDLLTGGHLRFGVGLGWNGSSTRRSARTSSIVGAHSPASSVTGIGAAAWCTGTGVC